MDSDHQAVVADLDAIEQLVQERALLGVGGVVPEGGEVDLVEQGDELVELEGEVVGLELGDGLVVLVGFEGFDLDGESGLFLTELLGADLSLVVQRQELLAVFTELREALGAASSAGAGGLAPVPRGSVACRVAFDLGDRIYAS